MDAGAAKYLQENVGGVLAKALAEMAVVQPKERLKWDSDRSSRARGLGIGRIERRVGR